MKKTLVLLISVILLSISFVSCNSDSNPKVTSNMSISEGSPTYTSSQDNNIQNDPSTNDSYNPADLSDQCDEVLGVGYTLDDQKIEIVVKQEDAYPKSTFYFGVIKNNEWLIELTSDCPFLDETGRWIGLDDNDRNTYQDVQFLSIGAGCFLYRCEKERIVYKPETGIWFPAQLGIYADPLEEDYSYEIMNDSFLLATTNGQLHLLNMDTGEKTKIDFGDRDRPSQIHPIGEGLFLADDFSYYTGKSYFGFFDIQGNLVIDMSKYGSITGINGELRDEYQRFENGKYTFICRNENGVRYKLTIDKTGTIIDEQKYDNNY